MIRNNCCYVFTLSKALPQRSAPATNLCNLLWMASLPAITSLRSIGWSPPRKSDTKPPASRTISRPAATSQG